MTLFCFEFAVPDARHGFRLGKQSHQRGVQRRCDPAQYGQRWIIDSTLKTANDVGVNLRDLGEPYLCQIKGFTAPSHFCAKPF